MAVKSLAMAAHSAWTWGSSAMAATALSNCCRRRRETYSRRERITRRLKLVRSSGGATESSSPIGQWARPRCGGAWRPVDEVSCHTHGNTYRHTRAARETDRRRSRLHRAFALAGDRNPGAAERIVKATESRKKESRDNFPHAKPRLRRCGRWWCRRRGRPRPYRPGPTRP